MGRTKLQTVAKLGSLEIKRRVAAAAPVKKTQSPGKVVKNGQPVVVGVKGNTGTYGYAETGEYVQKLQGARGRAIFDEMRRSDPQVQSILKAMTLPLRQATYYVEAASDDPTDLEIAETVQLDLLENMTMTWDDTLRHVLLQFPFGFSVLEKLYEIRHSKTLKRDYVTWRKFDPRLPISITGWQYDDKSGQLVGPVQMDGSGSEIVLPIEKCLVFTTEREGDNWEGISVLRSAYKPWYIKDTLEKIESIKHERHGVGIPVMTVPAGIAEGSPEWDEVVTILENIAASEASYVVEPEGYKFRVEGAAGKGTDILPTIKYYDEEIAKSALAMFINLGTTETGSRALGGSFLEVFRLALQAYADYICEIFNRYAIREMIDYNWTVDEYPVLKVRRIQDLDPQVIAVLKNAGVLTMDVEVENIVREELNLPERVEEELEEEQAEPEPEAPDEPDADGDVEQEDEDEEPPKRGFSFAQARQLFDWEKPVRFEEIEVRLNTEEMRLEEELLRIRTSQIEHVTRELVAGRKIQNIVVPGKKDMYDAMLSAFKASLRQGRADVHQEIIRQGVGIEFAEAVPTPEELLAIIAEEFGILVDGAADKLKAMVATMYLDLKKKGQAGNELLSNLAARVRDEVKDATWTSAAAAAINAGNGAGRDLGAKDFAEEVQECYYSALLDSNVCDNCRPKDGVRHELGDPEFVTPNPECKGGPRCRCLTVYVMKAEAGR